MIQSSDQPLKIGDHILTTRFAWLPKQVEFKTIWLRKYYVVRKLQIKLRHITFPGTYLSASIDLPQLDTIGLFLDHSQAYSETL